MSLYTRENKEKENVRQIIGEKEKDREKRKTSETQKKRTRKTPNTSN
jgi:hypothetical protein